MPQMSPMNWTTLFLSFSLIFILLNSNNYFFVKYSFLFKTSKSKLNKFNWKW